MMISDHYASWSIGARAAAAAELSKRAAGRFLRYFPDDGPLSRDHYPKHLEIMALGATKRERLFMAANRVGKTETGAYELVCHLTGLYPTWWTGRRFAKPIRAWAAGDTSTTVRDIIQAALLGPLHAPGTGMIPSHLIIGEPTGRTGVPGAKETIRVRHVSGGESVLTLKSYDQKRQAFQGTSIEFIWLDEECPDDIYTECVLRTMDTPDLPGGGLVLLTFTPLMGLTPLILQFLPGGGQENLTTSDPSKVVVQATWDDAPHLSAEAKSALWHSIQPYQRDARSKGIPQLGSGAIFQVPESDITVADFEIPKHWKRVFALDAGGGAKATAALWGAIEPETGTTYVYSVHKQSAAQPAIHIEAIKARGEWIPGVGDCAALIMTEHDAQQLIRVYQNAGLDIELPDKAVEAGIQETWELMSVGLFKVFASCRAWFEEFRLYRRDDKGRIVKSNDHLMDATRYLVRSGRARAKTKPVQAPPRGSQPVNPGTAGLNWMA
jgi:phage terminase large subunit-like protein